MSTFTIPREQASSFLHIHTIFKGTTLLGAGDPKLDHFDHSRLNVTPAHPHPGLSQAPHSLQPPTQHPAIILMNLSHFCHPSPLATAIDLSSQGSLDSPSLAPKKP